ncbi:MAG: hypothetical protein CL526_00395 [Aequorivita sp.]|nr:hypothetical protein [Aequorivita sp.]
MPKNTFQKILILAFLLTISGNTFSQTEEFVGLIELENKTFLNFRINFNITDSKVEGYTITDYNGPHESKSSIVGSYDERTNKLTFREVNILYTKSPITELDFCYIFFTGEMKKNRLVGSFKGFYEDLEKCLDGTIIGTRIEKAEKRKEKLLRKVNRVVKNDNEKSEVTQQINALKFSEQRGISANENINVFWEGSYLKALIWDAGTVDDDIIEISKDGTNPVTIHPKKEPVIKEFYLGADKQVITIKALSEGTEPPNTTKVKFTDGKGKFIELIYNLKVNESATLTFYTQKPKEVRKTE